MVRKFRLPGHLRKYSLLNTSFFMIKAEQKQHQSSEHFQQLVLGKIVPLLGDWEVTLTVPLLHY
jgi:hypothetical protein